MFRRIPWSWWNDNISGMIWYGHPSYSWKFSKYVDILQLIPYDHPQRGCRQTPHLLTMAKLPHMTSLEWVAATSGLSSLTTQDFRNHERSVVCHPSSILLSLSDPQRSCNGCGKPCAISLWLVMVYNYNNCQVTIRFSTLSSKETVLW